MGIFAGIPPGYIILDGIATFLICAGTAVFSMWWYGARHDWARRNLKLKDGIYASVKVIKMGSETIKFEANGFDFPELISNVVDAFTGKNKPLEGIVKQKVKDILTHQSNEQIAKVMMNPDIKKAMNKVIQESILEAFKDVTKKQGDKNAK
jgi:hypothetical protein